MQPSRDRAHSQALTRNTLLFPDLQTHQRPSPNGQATKATPPDSFSAELEPRKVAQDQHKITAKVVEITGPVATPHAEQLREGVSAKVGA